MKLIQKLLVLAFPVLLFGSCGKQQFIDQPGYLVPKTVEEDPALPSVTVNGVALHAEAFGPADSNLVICIHSGPGGDYRKMLNCKDLADSGYRVVFYDQRGSGLSQRLPERSYTSAGAALIDSMYNELSGIIAHYKTRPNQKVFLLGLSWGGILATGYAGKHPDAVQGLIVCEPGGFKWDDIAAYTKRSRSFNLWSEGLNDVTYIDQFMSGKEDQHAILDYKFSMAAARNEITGEDNTLPGSFWRYGAVINAALFKVGKENRPDFSEQVGHFAKQVLFFQSEKNKAYTDDWAHKIAGAFNAVTMIKVPGVAHDGIIFDNTAWIQTTRPQILTYLRSH